jgi:Tol biopolymer transport system component
MRAALLAIVLCFAAAPAQAAIVYEKGSATRALYVAGDDGSGSRRLVTGTQAHLSPDGTTVIYVAGAEGDDPQLYEIPVAGGEPKRLLSHVLYGSFAWSPDGRYVTQVSGPLNGKSTLNLIDRTTGTHRALAKGYFSGASFSPQSDRVVYGVAGSNRSIFAATNLFIAATVGGAPTPLGSDGRSEFPVWGPQKIAYTHWKRPPRKGDGPKFDIATVNPDGSGRTQLTHDKVPYLLSGLVPIDWSADGTRLLAGFGGQDTSYVVTVDPVTGKEKVIGSKSEGFIATGLSADGTTILGSSGGEIFGDTGYVVTAPYTGGKTQRLTKGQSPDSNR